MRVPSRLFRRLVLEKLAAAHDAERLHYRLHGSPKMYYSAYPHEVIVQFASREVLDHHRGLDDLNVLCCMTKHFLDELPRMVECALCPNESR